MSPPASSAPEPSPSAPTRQPLSRPRVAPLLPLPPASSFPEPPLSSSPTCFALDEVEFAGYSIMDGDDTYTYFNIRIRHALLCQARVLTVDLHYEFTVTLDDPPLVSRHLRRLELTDDIHLKGNILDFASCPALEDLKITSCGIFTDSLVPVRKASEHQA